MLKRKRIIFIVLITMLSINTMLANEYTNWSLLLRTDLNLNLHSSDGIRLNDLCSECVGLNNGFGLGFGLGLGVLYHNPEEIFGFKNSSGIIIGVNSRNALIENQAFLGNIIVGNEAKKGLVDYSMDNFILTLDIEPFLNLYLLENYPIALKLGISAIIPISAKYTFKESIATKGSMFENGSTLNEYPSTDLPNKSALFIGIPIGVRYDYQLLEQFTISPEINYNFAITNFKSDSKWNLNKFTIGLNCEYRFAKPEVPMPKLPPMPESPVLEEQKTNIDCFAKWQLLNKEYLGGAEVVVNSDVTDYYHTAPVMPFIFFEHNSAQLPRVLDLSKVSKSERINSNFESIQNGFYTEMPVLLSDKNNITVTAYYLENEDESIGKQRLENTVNYLSGQGIAEDRIIKQLKKIKDKSIKYSELSDEYQAVMVNFDDINNTYSKIRTNSVESFQDFELDLSLSPQSTAGIKSVSGEIILDGRKVQSFNSNNNKVLLTSNKLKEVFSNQDQTILQARYTVIDNTGNSKDFTNELKLKLAQTKLPDVVNFVDKSSNNRYNEFILAINSFDKKIPYLISDLAKDNLLEAISKDKHIEILGLTDNLGEAEYNSRLAENRIKSILKLLKVDAEKVKIMPSDSYIFDNTTIVGRMLNRSVIIRIYN